MLAKGIEILEEDRQILVVYKPGGMPVQSKGAGVLDLEHALLGYLADEAGGNSIPYLAVVHRLDQPVEGILVFAKDKKSAGELSKQLTDGRMKKKYLAVTKASPKASDGRLEDWLLKDGKTNTSKVVAAKTPGAKKALLDYQLMESNERGSLVEVVLHTGRHHQIRVQMAHNDMPLVGDRKYAGNMESEGLALCAYHLTFVHPKTGKTKEYKIVPKNPVFDGFVMQ